MRRYITIACCSLLTACSAPRYTYYFRQQAALPEHRPEAKVNPLSPPSSTYPLQASASAPEPAAPTVRQSRPALTLEPTPTEQSVSAAEPSPALPIKEDRDLRRSAIFTAAGLVALLIGGNVFWVAGSLSLMIGLIFGIRWLLRK